MSETNRLICGDCVDVMQHRIDAESVDLVVTSPPYDEMRDYQGYEFNVADTFILLWRVMKSGGVVVWIVGDQTKDGNKSLASFKHALVAQDVGFNVHDVMIYEKANTPFSRSNAYTNCFEYMFVFAKGKPKTVNLLKQKAVPQPKRWINYRQKDGSMKRQWVEPPSECVRKNIWRYPVGGKNTAEEQYAFKHPAMFPEKLAYEHIVSWSNEGDVVLDPFVGSGTTCKAAKQAGRNYIGIDVSQEYIDIAEKRLHGVLI